MQRLLQLKERMIREIPTEPQLNDTNATHAVIKLPNGRRLERRFLKTESMRSLYDFVFCNNDSPLNFIIRTNFSTRDLPGRSPQLEDFIVDDKGITRVDHNTQWTTLEESGVGHKEMLYIKELDN
jgi:FAS-associated factor 2